MKKIILSVALLIMAIGANAQGSFNRNGNIFTVTSSKHKADTLVTEYVLADGNGIKYPIIINKVSGRCWVWKTSSSGRRYKMYLSGDKEDIAKQIAKELGITYIPPKKRK